MGSSREVGQHAWTRRAATKVPSRRRIRESIYILWSFSGLRSHPTDVLGLDLGYGSNRSVADVAARWPNGRDPVTAMDDEEVWTFCVIGFGAHLLLLLALLAVGGVGLFVENPGTLVFVASGVYFGYRTFEPFIGSSDDSSEGE